MSGGMPYTPCSLEPLSNTFLAREEQQTSWRSSICLVVAVTVFADDDDDNDHDYDDDAFLMQVRMLLIDHLFMLFCSLCFQVPSHLFENFARTPSVISMWAKHHVTGERDCLMLGLEQTCCIPFDTHEED